jgi:hypothetical protein
MSANYLKNSATIMKISEDYYIIAMTFPLRELS